jgi:hypothetical protein
MKLLFLLPFLSAIVCSAETASSSSSFVTCYVIPYANESAAHFNGRVGAFIGSLLANATATQLLGTTPINVPDLFTKINQTLDGCFYIPSTWFEVAGVYARNTGPSSCSVAQPCTTASYGVQLFLVQRTIAMSISYITEDPRFLNPKQLSISMPESETEAAPNSALARCHPYQSPHVLFLLLSLVSIAYDQSAY